MSTLADLVTLGYTVDENIPDNVAAVTGHGVATMIALTDQAAIDSLAAAAVAAPSVQDAPLASAAANLAAAVQAVVSAPDFPSAQANLKALIQKK